MLQRPDSKRSVAAVCSVQLQRLVRYGCRPLNMRNIIQLISLWRLDASRLIVGDSFNLVWLYVTLGARRSCSEICHCPPLRNFSPFPCWPLAVSPCDSPEAAVHSRSLNYLMQRFSNFFQVGTTFISQNVLRTTLLLGLSNSLGLP